MNPFDFTPLWDGCEIFQPQKNAKERKGIIAVEARRSRCGVRSVAGSFPKHHRLFSKWL
jgi:hypothetical protein